MSVSIRRMCAAAALTAAVGFIAMPLPASAAPAFVVLPVLEGALTTPTGSLPTGTAGFAGTWDADTGAFVATYSQEAATIARSAPVTLPGAPPAEGTLNFNYRVMSEGDLTGVVRHDEPGSITGGLVLEVTVDSVTTPDGGTVPIGAVCDVPFEANLAVTPPPMLALPAAPVGAASEPVISALVAGPVDLGTPICSLSPGGPTVDAGAAALLGQALYVPNPGVWQMAVNLTDFYPVTPPVPPTDPNVPAPLPAPPVAPAPPSPPVGDTPSPPPVGDNRGLNPTGAPDVLPYTGGVTKPYLPVAGSLLVAAGALFAAASMSRRRSSD